jgi:hypothetical protein
MKCFRAPVAIRKRFLAVALVANATVCIISPAFADPPAEQFLQSRDDSQAALYITGIAVGFSWANAHLNQARQPLLFCAPEHGAITYGQMMDIMSSYVRDHRSAAAAPVGVTLMLALQDAYPCKR